MKLLKPFFLDLDSSEIDTVQVAIGDILRRGELILGRYTSEFEEAFAEYIGCRYAIAVNSGTSALEVLLTHKGARGKKVAVPSNTNFASVAAILRAGGQPIYMDMTAEYFAPNLEILKATVNNHAVEGVVWVHVGGIIVPDFEEIAIYCRDQGLFLIEDAAHAHGSRLGGRSAGTFGDGGAFSFFPTKVMTTMEGGMITTDNEEVAYLAKSFRNQGKRDSAYGGLHYDLGNSWRISEIGAFVGLVQLKKLDQMLAKREQAVRLISTHLRELGIEFCDTSHMDRASQYKFIVRFLDPTIDDAKRELKDLGVICGGGVYEVPCHQQPVFADLALEGVSLDVTEAWCPRHICPPLTSGTTIEDAQQIADALEQVAG